MGWGAATSLLDRLRREQEDERAVQRVRNESRSFRSWMRLGDGALTDFVRTTGQTPGDINPAGRAYRRAQAQDTSLRPSNIISRTRSLMERLQREAAEEQEREQSRALRSQRLAFEALPASRPGRPATLQEPAFGAQEQQIEERLRGRGGLDIQGLLDRVREQQRAQPSQQEPQAPPGWEMTVQLPPGAGGREELLGQEAQQEVARAQPGAGISGLLSLLTTPLPAYFGTGAVPEGEVRRPSQDPFGPLSDIPFAGGPLERSAEFITSPVGLASIPIAGPQAALAGEIGAVGLGTAGEALGLPTPAQYGLEALGGLAPASLVSRPGRAATQGLRRPRLDVPEGPRITAPPEAPGDIVGAVNQRPGFAPPIPDEPLPGVGRAAGEAISPPPPSRSPRGLLEGPNGSLFDEVHVAGAPGERGTLRTDGIEISFIVRDAAPSEIEISISRVERITSQGDIELVGRPSVGDISNVGRRILEIAEANPGKTLYAIADNPKIATMLKRLGATTRPGVQRIDIPTERLRQRVGSGKPPAPLGAGAVPGAGRAAGEAISPPPPSAVRPAAGLDDVPLARPAEAPLEAVPDTAARRPLRIAEETAEDAAARGELQRLGVPEMRGGEDAVGRLIRAIEGSETARGQISRAQTIERGRRSAAFERVRNRLIDQGVEPEEAFQRASRELAGPLTGEGQFAAVRADLWPEDVSDLFMRIHTKEGLLPFTRKRVTKALTQILDEGKVPVRSDLALLRRVYGPDLAEALLKKRGAGTRLWENILSGANVLRALQATADLSAPLRQGIMLVGHPKEFFGNWKPMVRAFASTNYANQADELIRSGRTPVSGRPWGEVMEESKLYLAPRGGGAELAELEEAFMGRLIHRAPIIGRITKASERAYVTFLNKLRGDIFKNTVSGWEARGVGTAADEAALARWLNIASGRGDLGAVGELVPALNALFFSPRLLASRVQVPIELFKTTPLVRKIVARDLAAFLGYGIGILTMAHLSSEAYEKQTGKTSPFSVELDPRSTDFGKVRVGPVRQDFWGGYQPLARYAAQIMTGEAKTSIKNVPRTGLPFESSERIVSLSRRDAALRFLRSKLSPAAGLGTDVLAGETFLGETFSSDESFIGDQAFQRLVPFFIQDVYESVHEQGALGGFLAIPGMFGASVQAYRSDLERRAALIAEDIATGKLSGDYDRQPLRIGELNPDDQARFRELHPELFEEFADRSTETLENLSGEQRGALIGQAQDEARSRFDKLSQDIGQGRFGDASEQDTRREIARQVGDIFNDRAAQIVAAIGEREDDEPISETQRILERYYQLQERHRDRVTDEDWASYEADLDRSFSDSERATIKEQTAAGDHEMEQTWRSMSDGLDAYYDLFPEVDETQSRLRQRVAERRADREKIRWRRRNPEGDGVLWALGRVSCVRSRSARSEAAGAYQRLYGPSVSDREVRVCRS